MSFADLFEAAVEAERNMRRLAKAELAEAARRAEEVRHEAELVKTRTENSNARQQAELDTTIRQSDEVPELETAATEDDQAYQEPKSTTAITQVSDTQLVQADAPPEAKFPNASRQDSNASPNALATATATTTQDTNVEQEAQLAEPPRQLEEAQLEGELVEARREEASLQREIELSNAREQCDDIREECTLNPATVQEDNTQEDKPTDVTSYGNYHQQESEIPEAITFDDGPRQDDELVRTDRDEMVRTDREPVGEVRAEIRNTTPKPAALTAQALSGLKSKKRKRPIVERSPSEGLFVNTGPSPTKQVKTEPKIKDEPDSSPATTSEEPVDSQIQDAEGVAKASFAPPKGRRVRRKAVYISQEVLDMRKKASDWYSNINTNESFARGDKATIDHVKHLIQNCIDAVKSNNDAEGCFSELRSKLHEMELYKFLTPVLVKKSRILEPGGLSEIFVGPDSAIFPWDIRADAEALWHRWIDGDLDGFLLRGICTTKCVLPAGAARFVHTLDPQNKNRRLANVAGENGLVNGQWWPYRLCALRDGAHGTTESGIYGVAQYGAIAIVLGRNKNGYANEDHGEIIEYCGTESTTPKPTTDTLHMEKAQQTKQPVRVLRAVNRDSKYAPKEGLRYDGLYEITARTLLNPATAMMRFSMRRVAGQAPIRFQGVEVRPTTQELEERVSMKKDLD